MLLRDDGSLYKIAHSCCCAQPAAFRHLLAGTTVNLAALPAGLPVWAVAALAGGVLGTQLGGRWLPVAVLRHLLSAILVIAGVKLIFT